MVDYFNHHHYFSLQHTFEAVSKLIINVPPKYIKMSRYDQIPCVVAEILDHSPRYAFQNESQSDKEHEYLVRWAPHRYRYPLSPRSADYVKHFAADILREEIRTESTNRKYLIIVWLDCWIPQSNLLNDTLLRKYQARYPDHFD